MVTIDPSVYKCSITDIIKLLDNIYDNLSKIKVGIINDTRNDDFNIELIKELYICGCQVTIISNTFDYYNMRKVIQESDISLCFLYNHQLNATVHPSPNSLIIDFTGDSCNLNFIYQSNNVNIYDLIIPNHFVPCYSSEN